MKSKRRIKLLIILTAAAFVAAVLVYSKLTSNALQPISYKNPYEAAQPFMEGIYTADHSVDAPMDYKIRALIVPHHLTATTTIASGLKMLEHQKFSKILLLSPDHFDRCPTVACTVSGVFGTLFGSVRSSSETVGKWLSSELVSSSPELFKNEHGIHAVLPYIAHYYPEATVTPLVISQKIPWQAHKNELLQLIENQMDAETIMVVSSDFSHYLSLSKADEMDEKTAKTIFSKDLKGLANLQSPAQSDCPNCLWLLGSIADKEDFYNPSVTQHSNSARILNDEKVPSTTSHFSITWLENSSLSSDDMAIGGDVTLTRTNKTPVLPSEISDWWTGSGLRLVNLEGPLGKKCATQSNPYVFCNREDLWNGIKGIATLWSVMNNHMLDLGIRGFEETKKLIRSAGEVVLTDAPFETEKARIYGFTAIMNPVDGQQALDLSKKDLAILADLKKQKDDKLTIVFVHYGTEYQALTSDSENRLLESFIDAGADAVVGYHSHVISDMRIYKGKPIFRSLGNLIFDQTDSVETSTAELVRLKKEKNHILFQTLIAPAGSDL